MPGQLFAEKGATGTGPLQLKPLWIILLSLWAFLLASGCGGGDRTKDTTSSDSPTSSSTSSTASTSSTWSIAEKNDFVLSRMREWYLWYDQIPSNLNSNNYSSPEAVLEAARYKVKDQWSYIASLQEITAQLSTGEFTGIGIRTYLDDSIKLWVRQVFPSSPASTAGILRGDRILGINGRTVEQIQADNAWDQAFGADSPGVTITLNLLRSGATKLDIKVTKATFFVNPVYTSKVIQQGSTKIAYLAFDAFTNAAYPSMLDAFNDFKTSGVTEMVLDLRYNSGGLVDIAAYLSSLMRDASDKDTFAILSYNNRHTSSNQTLNYTRMSSDLNLSRIFVITTSATCSASEMVIQGLKPFITVVTVGSTTCGKPVGMDLVPFDDLVLAAITFRITNVNGETDYFDGLSPSCAATDDLSHDLGDTNESSLAAALSFIARGSCPSSTKRLLPRNTMTALPRRLPDMGWDGMW
ncbi:MAG: PDZ domain-containing protein [Magnetococcales bacterium]|nr:PDZ domain-containing protein [Magnetococcales bacterium]MBF0151090.1 PDZ domain-containing protein [Magnetococcales bacterium]MBF0348462.1 PDZ domain-containing protein [Magnetococcales bacterium]